MWLKNIEHERGKRLTVGVEFLESDIHVSGNNKVGWGEGSWTQIGPLNIMWEKAHAEARARGPAGQGASARAQRRSKPRG